MFFGLILLYYIEIIMNFCLKIILLKGMNINRNDGYKIKN